MKSILKRSLALMVALLIALSVCACGGSGEGGNGDDKEYKPLEGETPVDLEGYEFTVVDFADNRWNKSISGTPYADAWVQFMDEVENLYNCTITALPPLSVSDMFTIIQPEIASGGKYADLVCTTQWQYGYFLGADVMMDLNKLSVNWDNPWWNQNIRNMATFDGKTCVGGGSFIFDTAQTWLLYYNDAVWKECGFEDPYKMVDEHRWTQDKFAEYCRIAARDRDGSGVLDQYDDRWGVIAANGDFCRAWYQAMGGKYFTTNPTTGHVTLACNTEHTYNIIEKMYNMVKKDKTVCTLDFANEAEKITQFVAGNSLFYAYMPGVGGLQDMEDDWGVLPLPLFDSNQTEYLSGVDHNSVVFGVTNTNQDIDKVSVVLEAMGRHAMILENIYWPDYKETYWDHPEEDSRMVSQYVVGHGQHDIALIMQNANAQAFAAPMSRVMSTVYGNVGADFSSWIDSAESTIETRIAQHFGY